MGAAGRFRGAEMTVGDAGSQRGFTLLELLVALTIFALIGVGAQRVLITVLTSGERAERQSVAVSELQRAVALIGRDIEQMTPRRGRDAYGGARPALLTGAEGELMHFTRRGWQSLLPMRRSELQPVAYRLEGGVLQRLYWNVLDPVPDSRPQMQSLLGGVQSAVFRFLDASGQWRDRWPVGEDELPLAVEMALETATFGTIRRVWEVRHED